MKGKSVHAVHKLKRIMGEIIAAMPEASSFDMAKRAMARHADIITEWLTGEFDVQRQGPRSRHSPMIGKRPRLGHPGQGRLPGYEEIPEFLFLTPTIGGKQGKRVRTLSATLADQIQSLDLAVNESAEELSQRRKLIALTRRYDRTKPGIVVREVLALQAVRDIEAARKRTARRSQTARTKNQ